jgi:hypothetical protein
MFLASLSVVGTFANLIASIDDVPQPWHRRAELCWRGHSLLEATAETVYKARFKTTKLLVLMAALNTYMDDGKRGYAWLGNFARRTEPLVMRAPQDSCTGDEPIRGAQLCDRNQRVLGTSPFGTQLIEIDATLAGFHLSSCDDAQLRGFSCCPALIAR